MQPLESYLTKAGWRKDLDETIDHIVDSGCSPTRLSLSSQVQSVGLGVTAGSLGYTTSLSAGVGIFVVAVATGALHRYAAGRKYKMEQASKTGKLVGYAGLTPHHEGVEFNPEWVTHLASKDSVQYGPS